MAHKNAQEHRHKLPGVLIVLQGKQINLKHDEGVRSARKMLNQLARRRLTSVLLRPSTSNFLEDSITDLRGTFPRPLHVRTHAVLVGANAGLGIVMQTRDCPTVVLLHHGTGELAVVHAGREQLSTMTGDDLLTQVVRLIAPSSFDRALLSAHITGGISAKHFRHDQNPELVLSFRVRFQSRVFSKPYSAQALDLRKVIERILVCSGVKETSISHDGLCTFKDHWLGSRRAEAASLPNKEHPNHVLVVRQPGHPGESP